MGLLLLTLTRCGLALDSRLLIEIQLKELAFVKPDRTVSPIENTFFDKSKHLHLHCYISSSNTYEFL